MIGPEQLAAGERAETAGDFVAAAAAYRAVIAVPDEKLVAKAYFCLGRVSWRQGRYDAALSAFENSRVLAERIGDEELHARIDNGIGVVLRSRGDHAGARKAWGAAEQRTADNQLRSMILLNLGVVANVEGDFEEALDLYDRSYRISLANNDEASAMLALHNRGMVEADLKQWDEADSSFLAALRIANEKGNREMIAKTLVNRSEVLVARDRLSEALEHCDRALEIYSLVGDEVGRGEALRWRAQAIGGTGDLGEAERSAAEALQIAMRAGARLLEAESSRDLGVIRGLRGDRAGGAKQLKRALVIFNELGAKRESLEVAELLQRPTPARSLKGIELKK